jgi:hypothetical protein
MVVDQTYAAPLNKDAVHQIVSDISRQQRGFLDNMFMLVGEDDDIHSLKNEICRKLTADDCPLKVREEFCSTHLDRVLHSVARCLLPRQMSIPVNLLELSSSRQSRPVLSNPAGLEADPYNEEQWYSLYRLLKVIRPVDDPSSSSSWTTTEATGFIGLLCRLWGSMHGYIQRISGSSRPTSNLCLAELFEVRGSFPS